MKRALIIAFLLTPLGALAWHYGPGQTQLANDRADAYIRQAEAAVAEEDWERAVELFNRALELLPDDDGTTARRDRQRILLAQVRARIQAGQIIEGEEQLVALLEDVQTDDPLDAKLATAVRHEIAMTGYHTAWLMRLEGAAPEEWKPEAELARQHFRLLAEQSETAGDEPTAFHKNLEATIRLEQMDLSELRARPLPRRCPNPKRCRNLSQRKRKQCQSRRNSPGKKKGKGKKKKGPSDARKKIKKQNGAGLNRRQGSGS